MVRTGGPKRYFALGVIVLALATPVSAAALWTWEGVDGPVTARATPIVPGALESLSADGTEPRTLVVTTAEDGAVDYTVVRGREPQLGEEVSFPKAGPERSWTAPWPNSAPVRAVTNCTLSSTMASSTCFTRARRSGCPRTPPWSTSSTGHRV